MDLTLSGVKALTFAFFPFSRLGFLSDQSPCSDVSVDAKTSEDELVLWLQRTSFGEQGAVVLLCYFFLGGRWGIPRYFGKLAICFMLKP